MFNFGSSTQTSQPASSFNFGNPTTSSTGFGNQNATTSSSFGFGNPPSTPAFGFGNQSTNTTTANQPLFGAAAQTGSTLTQPTSSSSFSSFGTGTFNFGNQPTTSSAPSFGFGASSNNTGSSLFGSFNQPKTTQTSNTSSFPSLTFGNTSSTFGSTAAQPSREEQIWAQLVQVHQDEKRAKNSMQPSSGPISPDNVWQALALLRSWWDPKSPNCQFRYYFYNLVSPQEVHLYQRPENHDPKAWEDAQKSNPDPSCMVPALVVGFEEIQKRIDIQDKTIEVHRTKLTDIEEKIKKLQRIDLLETAKRLEEYRSRQRELSLRVLNFLKYAMVVRKRGTGISAPEEVMRSRCEDIQEQLQRSEQFHGKLSQLWAQLQLIKESGSRKDYEQQLTASSNLTPQNLLDIGSTLNEQQNGIQHLFDTLQKNEKGIEELSQSVRN